MSDTITVTMLSVLKLRFQDWLGQNGLILVQPPADHGTDHYVVVPHPARTDLYPPRREPDS